MRLTVIGSGDAFGSGGRLQTCFYVTSAASRYLIDCGATALIGFHRQGLDPLAVDTVFLSHLHGDHFSGLVWWLLHAQHVARRSAELVIVGPVGTEARVTAACEALFPGSTKIERRFPLRFVEFEAERPLEVGGVRLTAFEVDHPSGALSAALRFEHDGRVLSFSGDTQWVDTLIPCAAGADLFITECYAYDLDVPYHISWQTLSQKLPLLQARRILLSHMSNNMLAARSLVQGSGVLFADDGLILDI